MPATRDTILVKLSLSGDRNAFGKLIDRYKNLVYGLLLSRIGDPDQAEDLAQDAFMRAYEHLESLRRPISFSSWLCGIARNVCNEWLGRRARESQVLEELTASPDEAGAILTFRGAPRPETPEEEYASLELRQTIWHAVQELPEGSREAILLFYLNEMSSIEIADFLGITPSAVRSRLQTGREQLRDRMMPFAEEAIKEQKLSREFTQKVVAALPTTTFSEPKPLLPFVKLGLSLKSALAGVGLLAHLSLKKLLAGICVLAAIGGIIAWTAFGGGRAQAPDETPPMQVRIATPRERSALLHDLHQEDGAGSSPSTYGWGRDTHLSAVSASFIGEDAEDEVGGHGSIGGDMNGDGYDDILIGAYGDDDKGRDAGQIYLIFGRSTLAWHMDMDLSASDASFIGEAMGDVAGISVSSTGDVNGDGYDDILIGACNNDEGGGDAGQIYLIFGKPSGWRMDTHLADADASFIGEHPGDKAGQAASITGDVNGDGYDDILVGARGNDEGGNSAGQVYLILGKPYGWRTDTHLSKADASFIGEHPRDGAGGSASTTGDVNGDGHDDIIISAWNNSEGGSNAGQVYLVLGKPSGWSMYTDLPAADASFIGENAGDVAGYRMASGDVNGDGYDDILIGANHNSEGGKSAGQVYLILGKSSGWRMDTALSTADASFIGEHAYEYAPRALDVGDVNRDGYDDIVIGTCGGRDGNKILGDLTGRVYLILGKSSGWHMDTSLSTADASFIGEDAEDLAGFSVAGRGDINGDGYHDILIGATENDERGHNVGQMYLVLSR